MPLSIINGNKTDHIDVYDRGLQYGDGLFETIALKNNELQFWNEHLQRMNHGCTRLKLPNVNEQKWLDDIQALGLRNTDTVIKLILTRGSGGRGYSVANVPATTRIVSAYDLPEYPVSNYTKGIRTIFCNTPISTNRTLAGIKHLNRLDNVLARNEWNDNLIHEGFMLNEDEQVIEGTMSNVFSVNNQVLYTPILDKSGVEGVIRNAIIRLAHENDIEVQEIRLTKDLLLNMDEIFISNSLIGIWPVSRLQNQSFKVGETTLFFMNKLNLKAEAHKL